MASLGTSLSLHILQQEQQHPEFAGQLSMLLNQMAFAAKILSREISRAALVGKLGLVGEKNPTGDSQKKLDVYTNEVIIQAFADTKLVAAVAAEELEDIKSVPGADDADYVLSIDPLDGSSNTDINGALGTIFGIHPRKKGPRHGIEEDFRRTGSEQVVAGYVMYSTSTVLVYTIGHGVHGFTLDRDLGEFLLSHENIQCPRQGKTYSANLANSPGLAPQHPQVHRLLDGTRSRHAPALLLALHGRARGGLAPLSAGRRHLFLPGRSRPQRRQAPPDVRMRAAGFHC